MNLANILTCSRMVMAVFFTASLFSVSPFGKIIALVFFVAASVTDYYDGMLARQMGQVSAFGKMMDPLADKVLTLSAFLSFWWLGLIPLWMVSIVIVRDVFVTLSRFNMPEESAGRSARQSGKSKTVIQIVFIISVLIYLIASQLPYWPLSWNQGILMFIRVAMGGICVVTVWSALRIWKHHG